MVDQTCYPKRPAQGPPLDGELEALRIGVKPCPSPCPILALIHDDGGDTAVVTVQVTNSNKTNKLGSGAGAPASHTCPDWFLRHAKPPRESSLWDASNAERRTAPALV